MCVQRTGCGTWSICLAVVAVLSELITFGFRADAVPVIGNWLNDYLPEVIINGFRLPFYFGGVPLLILVSVLMDTARQAQSQLVRLPPLANRSGDDSALPEVDYEDFVPVLVPQGAGMEPFIKTVLESAGIRCSVKNEGVQDLFGYGRVGTGFSVFAGTPAVLVEPTRAEESAELLASIEAEQLVGTVVHYFARPEVGVIHLGADLNIGDTLHFLGRGADFRQVVTSMETDHRLVESASADNEVAVKVDQRVRAGTQVYRVTPAEPQAANT